MACVPGESEVHVLPTDLIQLYTYTWFFTSAFKVSFVVNQQTKKQPEDYEKANLQYTDYILIKVAAKKDCKVVEKLCV